MRFFVSDKEHLQKKNLILFGLFVEDIKISDIFYKIQNFQGTPLASIITRSYKAIKLQALISEFAVN